MLRTQVYDLVNHALKQTVGAETLVSEDLQSVIDAGAAVFDNSATEQFTKALIDQIGRIKIESKTYKGRYPKMLREAWEFGSVLMTVKQTKLPQANVNESWDLEDATSYDPNIVTVPSNIEVKFWNGRVTFEVPYTLVNYQLKEAFQGPDQLASFIGMLTTNVNNAMELAIGNLTKRTLNNFIGEVINANGVQAMNILSEYETASGKTLTAAKALYDPDFLRYAAFKIGEVTDRLKDISEKYNLTGAQTFSTEINTVYLSDFKRAMGVYLYNANGQFKDNELQLPEGESIPFWQGEGTSGYALNDIASIKITTSENHSVDTKTAGKYILAVQYDNDACCVACLDRHTTSHYNGRAEFTNFWDKATMGSFNDFSKNFVVYYIAD